MATITESNKPFNIEVSMSLFDLIDGDVNFASECIQKPINVITLLQEVAASTYDVIYRPNEACPNSRFYIKLKYTDVPPIERLLLTRSEQILTSVNHIITFTGLVMTMQTGFKFTRSCFRQCRDKNCKIRSNGNICVFYPEFSDSISDTRSQTCPCGFDLKEKINERIDEEMTEFSVLLLSNNLHVNRPLFCVARGSLGRLLQIGKMFSFIGYPIIRGTFSDMRIKVEINNIMETDKLTCNVEHLSWMNIWRFIPQEISSYEFGPSFTMAFMFADEVTPPGSFFFLKLVLMLLMLSDATEVSVDSSFLAREELRYRPILLLIAAYDTNVVSKIINVARCYSSEIWIHGSQDPLLGRVSNKENIVFVESSTLLLPDNYVALLPNLMSLSTKQQGQLKKVLLDRFVQPLGKTGGTLYQEPLCCKIWTTVDLTTTSASGVNAMSDSMKSIAQAFDLICLVEDPAEYDGWDSIVAAYLMERSIGGTNPSNDEYHQLYHAFLQNSSRISVTKWSHDAQKLLRGYYIIGRKITTKSGVALPQSALAVLLQFATNLAKLSNRVIISPCDSMLAIYLYEVLYSSTLGHTFLGISDIQFRVLANIRSIDGDFLEHFLSILHMMQKNLIELINKNLDPMFLEE